MARELEGPFHFSSSGVLLCHVLVPGIFCFVRLREACTGWCSRESPAFPS